MNLARRRLEGPCLHTAWTLTASAAGRPATCSAPGASAATSLAPRRPRPRARGRDAPIPGELARCEMGRSREVQRGQTDVDRGEERAASVDREDEDEFGGRRSHDIF